MDILQITDKICKENAIEDNIYGNMLLTTLKFDSADQKKVSLKIRTAEGQLGSLSIFVLPRNDKADYGGTCATLEVPLKPLNLHERINSIP